MSAAYDLVIRKGLVVDGGGGEPTEADVAVEGGVIAAIGAIAGRGVEEVDARGLIVTPGFVDAHTHYDAQVTWEHTLGPSSSHGVTTAVIGNCGVGFAPCRPDERELLIKLMEGVEDIPELVMATGIPWAWETFGEYLDWLATRRYDIDFGALAPHAPLRVYAMGRRGADREPATGEDLRVMADLVRDAMRAGALGVSTSRSQLHRTKAGALAPTVTSGEEELRALAVAMGEGGAGVLQLLDDFNDVGPRGATDLDMIKRIALASGRPVTFPVLEYPSQPGMWRHLLDAVSQANGEGIPLVANVFPRAVAILFGMQTSAHPFSVKPSYQPLVALLPEERVAAMRDPGLRRRLIDEAVMPGLPPTLTKLAQAFDGMFRLNDPPQYEPDPKDMVRNIAAQRGVSLAEAAYDILLEKDGRQLLVSAGANFNEESLDHVHEMLTHPNVVVALGDGGAHYGMICDAGYTSFVLAHWVRDRTSGPRLPLQQAVRMLSRDPAESVGLNDRGRLAPGLRADVNVIDLDRLRLGLPYGVATLPGGGRRLTQDVEGYRLTLVAGVPILRDDKPTGARPGRLIRGPRGAPETLRAAARALHHA